MSTQKNEKQPKSGLSTRSPKCCRCRNHGVISVLRGHKRFCQWKNCTCDSCVLLMKRQQNSKEQIALRRLWRQEEDMGLVAPIPSNADSVQILLHRYPHYDVEKLGTVLKSCDGDTQKAMAKIDTAMTRALDDIILVKSDLSPTGDTPQVTSGGLGFLGYQGYNAYHTPVPTVTKQVPRTNFPMYPRAQFVYPYNPTPRYYTPNQPDVTFSGDFHSTQACPPQSFHLGRSTQALQNFPASQPRGMFYPDGQGSVDCLVGYNTKPIEVSAFQSRTSPASSDEGPLVIDMKDEDGSEGLLPNFSSQ